MFHPGYPELVLELEKDELRSTASHPLRGILRSQDIRATEKDRVQVGSAVRVGDVILCDVASVGDQGGMLSLDSWQRLGVVLAWSTDEGNVLCSG